VLDTWLVHQDSNAEIAQVRYHDHDPKACPVLAVWKHSFNYSWPKRNNPLALPELNIRHDGDRDPRRQARTNPCRHAMRGGVYVNQRQIPIIRRSLRSFIATNKPFQFLSVTQKETAFSMNSGLFSLFTYVDGDMSAPKGP
jgi:hypothetical protein